MRGPTPSRRLMAVKAAEFRGDVILLSKSPMGMIKITWPVDKFHYLTIKILNIQIKSYSRNLKFCFSILRTLQSVTAVKEYWLLLSPFRNY